MTFYCYDPTPASTGGNLRLQAKPVYLRREVRQEVVEVENP